MLKLKKSIIYKMINVSEILEKNKFSVEKIVAIINLLLVLLRLCGLYSFNTVLF